MGNCTSQQENQKKNSSDNIQGYIFSQIIGKGGFGKVWSVMKRKTKEQLAMKIMSKVKILSKKSVNSVINERKILSHLSHPLIVNMHCSFQDRENLYLTMDYISGGDLRFHLIHSQTPFTEAQSLFITGCIVSSLEYIHSNNILHRDIKPENLIFDENGYLKITDFGISRAWRPDNSSETSGTPGYIAPEILMRQNYGVAVDYYALGIILYEIAMGRRPYKAKDRKELREQIMAKQVQIKVDEVPKGWSLEAIDFINRLIQRKPQNRLGVNGPSEVKEHIWLKSFPWTKLLNGELEASFKPPKNCIYNFSGKQNTEQSEVDKQNAMLLRKDEVQELFKGYEYDSSKQTKMQQYSQNGTPFTSGHTSFTSSTQNKSDPQKKCMQQIANLQKSPQLINNSSNEASQVNYAQQSQIQSQSLQSQAIKQPNINSYNSQQQQLEQGSNYNINSDHNFVDKIQKKLDHQSNNNTNNNNGSKKTITDNDDSKYQKQSYSQQQHKSTSDDFKITQDQQHIHEAQHA